MPHVIRLISHKIQLLVLLAIMRVLRASQPILLTGPGSAQQMCRDMAMLGARRVLIVTDAMDMHAITRHFDPGEASVLAVLAGAVWGPQLLPGHGA